MNKLFLIKIFIFLVKPLYYLIHKNFFFGLIQKHLIKNFYYKSLKFKIDYDKISIAYASSFLFKTYEYNDRILIEKHISEKNKSIIIGGGIGFIASLNFMKSSNEFLISEIDDEIINILKKNLKQNKCKYELIDQNLLLKKDKDYETFFIQKDFIANSKYLKNGIKKLKKKNIELFELKDHQKYNTLIIDGEGIEEHFIKNLDRAPYIKYLFFELHSEILGSHETELLFEILKKNNFGFIDNCFNSFYFKKNV